MVTSLTSLGPKLEKVSLNIDETLVEADKSILSNRSVGMVARFELVA